MEEIRNIEELKFAIARLETKRYTEGLVIKKQFDHVRKKLRPENLLKNALKGLIVSSEIKNGVIDASLGLTAGILTKKAIKGDSDNILTHIISIAAQTFVTAKVTKKGKKLRSWIQTIIKNPTT